MSLALVQSAALSLDAAAAPLELPRSAIADRAISSFSECGPRSSRSHPPLRVSRQWRSRDRTFALRKTQRGLGHHVYADPCNKVARNRCSERGITTTVTRAFTPPAIRPCASQSEKPTRSGREPPACLFRHWL